MRSVPGMLVALLVLCFPVTALGGITSGIGSFSKLVPGSDRRVPITEASFVDKVYVRVIVIADDGEHPLQVTIYDGSGREVYNSESTVNVKDGRAVAAVLYGFNPKRDAPGTWLYVAAVGGKVIASKSLQVSPR